MSRKQLKFVIGPVIVVLVLVWIATSALTSTLAYFQTVSEVYAMETAGELEGKRLRVMGEVVPGTIVRTDEAVKFTIVDLDTHQTMDIEYIGNSPVPDTLRELLRSRRRRLIRRQRRVHRNHPAGQVRLQIRA